MLRSKLFLITSITVLFQITSISSGSLVLDQAQSLVGQVPGLVGIEIIDAHWQWQEFKPTMNNLEQVDLYLANWNAPDEVIVSFEIRNQNDDLLWDTSFSAGIIPDDGWFSLDTPQVEIIPEQTY